MCILIINKYSQRIYLLRTVFSTKIKDGSLRLLSKFVPNNTTKITQEVHYTMDINCLENSFKDVAVGTTEFNKIKKPSAEWQDPNEDKLILGIIDQVCTYIN